MMHGYYKMDSVWMTSYPILHFLGVKFMYFLSLLHVRTSFLPYFGIIVFENVSNPKNETHGVSDKRENFKVYNFLFI